MVSRESEIIMCLKWEERSCLFGIGNLEFSALFPLLASSCCVNWIAEFISFICKVEITNYFKFKWECVCVPFVTELALPLSVGVASLPRLQIFSVLSTSRGALQQLQSKVCGEEGAEHVQGKQPCL